MKKRRPVFFCLSVTELDMVKIGSAGKTTTGVAEAGSSKLLRNAGDYAVPVGAGIAGFGLTSLLAGKADDSKGSSGTSSSQTSSPFGDVLSPSNVMISCFSSSSSLVAVIWIAFVLFSSGGSVKRPTL